MSLRLTRDEPAPVHVAVVAGLSGPGAERGQAVLRGTRLHLDQINNHGGVAGHPVRLLVHDDKDDPETARRVARKVVEDDRAALVVGHTVSGTALAAGPVYAGAGIAAITPTATADAVTGTISGSSGPLSPWLPGRFHRRAPERRQEGQDRVRDPHRHRLRAYPGRRLPRGVRRARPGSAHREHRPRHGPRAGRPYRQGRGRRRRGRFRRAGRARHARGRRRANPGGPAGSGGTRHRRRRRRAEQRRLRRPAAEDPPGEEGAGVDPQPVRRLFPDGGQPHRRGPELGRIVPRGQRLPALLARHGGADVHRRGHQGTEALRSLGGPARRNGRPCAGAWSP
ncbi:ABC transporter substrate-binding protein [Streptomyces sp. G44]|nr:ABC transporter substrate-binding protein [Streptomyces sp. G44]